MITVLLCSVKPLDDLLNGTLLWREDVNRRLAHSVDEAEQVVKQGEVDILVVDRDLPGASELIGALRKDLQTRNLSIAVVADGDFEAGEIELLSAGAWAILRLPPDAEWEERLARLMSVPARKDVRLEVSFEIEMGDAGGITSAVATTLNLSARGMLIECAFPLQLGDVLDLRFQLPGAEHTILGCGRIVRQAGRNRFGLEFYGLENEGASHIEHFVGSK